MKTVHTKLFLLFALIVYLRFPNATGAKPDQETPSKREQAPGSCGSETLEAGPAADTQDTQDTHGRPAADTQDTRGSAEARSAEDKRQVCNFFF